MKFKVILITIILIIFSTFSIYAETLTLTLDEAIVLGLKNSTDIQSKLLAVYAARASLQFSRSAYYPSVSGSASWTHLFDQPKTSDIDIPNIGTIEGSYVASKDPIALSVNVNQSIYAFGKIKKGVEMAEENLKLAQLELEEAKRKLIIEIKRAFYGYILAKEVLRIQKETLQYKKEALEVAKKRFQAGLIPDFEVLQAESDLESFYPQIISSENQVKFALLAVMNLLGIQAEGGKFDVELKGALEPIYYDLKRENLLKMAVEQKTEIKQYRTNLRLAELNQDLTKAAKKPVIAGFVNYTLQSGYDSQTGENRYWGENSWEGDLTCGASIQMPLSALFPWSGENMNIKKGELELQQMKLGLSSLESGIRLSIENALLKLEEEKAKINSGRKGVELALKLYQSARKRYETGLSSSIELKDAQVTLNNAQMGYITSIYNYNLTLFNLMDAVGVEKF